jgi:hypothetical protein
MKEIEKIVRPVAGLLSLPAQAGGYSTFDNLNRRNQ